MIVAATIPDPLDRLQTTVREMHSVLVAFSGGIDSALVLKVAADVLGDGAAALTAVGPALPGAERAEAARFAASLGVRHFEVRSDEIHNPNYRANPRNRCFYCKTELYRHTEETARAHGYRWVVNGTNTDDLGDFRPGLQAATAARVRSPLVEAGIAKPDVRSLAQRLGMELWDKPAAACLASRIPYGTEVTVERLSKVGTLEAALRHLGLKQVRVRYHDTVARVEVAPAELQQAFELRDAIVSAGREAGFHFVALDLEGYRPGSLNRLE